MKVRTSIHAVPPASNAIRSCWDGTGVPKAANHGHFSRKGGRGSKNSNECKKRRVEAGEHVHDLLVESLKLGSRGLVGCGGYGTIDNVGNYGKHCTGMRRRREEEEAKKGPFYKSGEERDGTSKLNVTCALL